MEINQYLENLESVVSPGINLDFLKIPHLDDFLCIIEFLADR
jgi:hypothetical protein